ncbi:MAG: glycerophosphodiester phosphodiesterase [Ectothiorhodospiraceae bacterium]|nr:glycerophosphodiester phosphodiesterase [Ectothiorhodospiraceae bacterium]
MAGPESRRSCRRAGSALAVMLVASSAGAFDIQGHRGARGLAPENTLAGFRVALGIGVSTLELDTGITRDGVVVVAHDRALNPATTRDAAGRWLATAGPTLRSLSHAELLGFDVGRLDPASKYAARYPEQRAVDGEVIPRLADVLALGRLPGAEHLRFNIETKLDPRAPDETAPAEAFADRVVEVIRASGLATRATVQSFDWRTLRRVDAVAPEIETACLTVEQRWLDNVERGRPGASAWTAGLDVDDHGGSVPALVAAAGCEVWSPHHQMVDAASLADAHARGLRVVPWTVNEAERMRALIELGVDGLISDYPDRLREVVAAAGLALPPAVSAR